MGRTGFRTHVALGALAVALVTVPAAAQTGSPAVADPNHAEQGPAPAGTSSDAPSPVAQSSDGTGADIVVTGSRIRHSPLEQPQPVTFVDQADIARTGLSSIADVLQRLPSSAGGLNTKNNSSGNLGNPPDGGGVGAGSSQIDLRYLGAKRTLVLVDSMRFINGSAASGIPAAVDLNAIPQSAIERVEVLQDGASAIYGSDAISGVVNIITKTKQDGLLVSAQHGLYREGDGVTRNYDASYGVHIGSLGTDIVVGGDYVQQDPVFAGERGFSKVPLAGLSSYVPNGRFIIDTPSGVTLSAPVTGRAPTLADYRPYRSGVDGYNYASFNYLLTPYKRYGGFVNVEQPIAGDTKLSGKFFYNRRESQNQAAPLPLALGPSSGNSTELDAAVIDGSNPYNPFGTLYPFGPAGADGIPTPGNYSTILRRLVEGGPRHYSQRVDTYYGTATLSGKFQLLNHDWYWDVNGVYGKTNASQSVTGNVNADNVLRALGPVANCTAPCVPLNLFGGAGTITPEMYNYIAFTQHDRSSQRLIDGTANLSGALFDLPAGPLGVAVGYEHRAIKGSFTPDPLIQAGLGADIPAAASSGSYHSDEVYGELSVPILKDKPFFEELNGSFAVRYSDYSISGSKTTFKAGGDWKPVNDLLLRGTFAQGFRAPAIAELFGSPSRFDDPANDPCTGASGDSALAQRCAAGHVALNGQFEPNNTQLPVFTSGNPNLKPETSRSWVGGAVYSASWARSFAQTLTLEASYFNVKVKHAIGAVDTTTRLNDCYIDGDPSACAAVTRSPVGQITRIDATLQNLSSLKTDGLDLNLNVRTNQTGAGVFGLNWSNTWTFSFDQVNPTNAGTETIKRVGTESGSQAYPRLKSIAIGTWTLGEFTASLTGRYISGVREYSNDEHNNHLLSRRLYGDVQLVWDTKLAERNFSFAVGVNNIAGTAPPICYNCQLNNYDPSTYDLPSQFFYVRAGVKL